MFNTFSSDRAIEFKCSMCGESGGNHTWTCLHNFESWPKSGKCPRCGSFHMTKNNPVCPLCGVDHTMVECPVCGHDTPRWQYDRQGCGRKWFHPDQVAAREEAYRKAKEAEELRNRTMFENPVSILSDEVSPVTIGNFNYILKLWATGYMSEREHSMVGMLLRLLILGEKPVLGPETLGDLDDGSED